MVRNQDVALRQVLPAEFLVHADIDVERAREGAAPGWKEARHRMLARPRQPRQQVNGQAEQEKINPADHLAREAQQQQHRLYSVPAQAPYLNDSDRRARNCVTLPFSTLTSSLVTSAMRRSRSDLAAVFTALRAASSQETELVPMTSVTR